MCWSCLDMAELLRIESGVIVDSDSDDRVEATIKPGPGAADRIELNPTVGSAAERRVLAALADGGLTSMPAWVQSAVALYGQPALGRTCARHGSWLQRQGDPLSTMHDCRGIDGAGEALRLLTAPKILVGPHALKAASERAEAPRL